MNNRAANTPISLAARKDRNGSDSGVTNYMLKRNSNNKGTVNTSKNSICICAKSTVICLAGIFSDLSTHKRVNPLRTLLS